MNSAGDIPIPNRPETLKVLRAMGDYQPMLTLDGKRPVMAIAGLDGNEIPPAIATYLMKSGYLVAAVGGEMLAGKLVVTKG